QQNLAGNLNGYYVQIGNRSDAIDLVKQSGTTNTRIIEGTSNRVNANAPKTRVKVTHDFEGNWTLTADTLGGIDYKPEGTGSDATFTTSAFFGVTCVFTATRRQGFFFDDFEVKTANFQPPVPVNYKDVVITEIFPDELPRVGLPEKEFVEIFNRSTKDIKLGGFVFADLTSNVTLPNFTLLPNEYVILCRSVDTLDFKPFGKTLGLSSLPSLNNSGDNLTLKNRQGNLLDFVNYTSNWYRDATKTDGGWTLELIDTDNICSEASNWAASVNPAGGTPGKINSVKASNPDLAPPKIITVNPENIQSLLIHFDERLDTASLRLANAFSVDNSISISKIIPQISDLKQVILEFSSPLSNRTVYTLTISQIKDACGNTFVNPLQVQFSLPEQGDSNDVVINEVLFNPKSGGIDFVEIYNRSEKFVNLKGWLLGRIADGKIEDTSAITLENIVIQPKTYLALNTDGTILKTQYPKAQEANFLLMSSFPSYNDDEGGVVLFNNQKKLIDRFDYKDDFHFKLLDDKEGVSLERIDVNTFGNSPENWHSTAQTEGFATPGYKNSQTLASIASQSPLTVNPKVFAPDQDGFLDFMTISYFFNNTGNVANVSIFDSQGREVKKIASNQSLSTSGTFQWDGLNNNGEKVRIGLYVVYVQLFELGGTQKEFKETVAVGTR
ncbi:MAG: lamin tail domain-containing protein, partial [Verrucomicrobia bacterium]|nr:lamin tail domain-containing protein [Cytophagales bacterium]